MELALRQAMQDIPDLKNLAENLIIDRTPEGLRIQIVDQDKTSMFPLGSSEMAAEATENSRTMIRLGCPPPPSCCAVQAASNAKSIAAAAAFRIAPMSPRCIAPNVGSKIT